MTKLTARVPATAANLGPGFDCFALALDLVNEVTLDTDAPPVVEVEGEGRGELATDRSNLLVRSMERVAHESGTMLPPLGLSCVNRIPLERGLGSSAAAVVAGVALADRLMKLGLTPDELLQLAVDLEGHPDNVAGALRGGLTLAYRTDAGWRAQSLAPAPALQPVALVPEGVRLVTSEARRAMPPEVPLADAAYNAGRAALAVVALTSRPDLLVDALEDRLHQPFRLPLVPTVNALFAELRAAGIPVCVAGAGPTLLAFESDDAKLPELGDGWRVMRLAPRALGVEVS